ncbi:MAG TPA: hypothetical protein VM409_08550, partial [Chloroflexia bacterium]|nr:hypothetical protein [Chloroflexia bacterium]
SAQSAVSASKFESAGQYAQAALELVNSAESQMGYTLGFDKLPSAAQRPQGPKGHRPGSANPATMTISQAQASRLLAQTYNRLISQKTLIKSGEATPYLTEAQNAYRTAYAAYGVGKYDDALQSARVASELSEAALHVQAAVDAPNGADTPVTVPAPNF